MRFLALACDYDGTLAHHGRVEASTIAALERVRASGRKLLLVTGRQLDDLRSVFVEVDLFDAVVAENGALLYDPRTQREQRDRGAARGRVRRGAAPALRPGLGRPRHRRHLGASRARGARHHPRPRPRAPGDLQQRRGDGATGGREQGVGARGRARRSRALTAQRGRRRRRRERPCLPVRLRVRGGGGQRPAHDQGARRRGDQG